MQLLFVIILTFAMGLAGGFMWNAEEIAIARSQVCAPERNK